MKLMSVMAGAVALALVASSASAQERISLSAGFLPDPVAIEVNFNSVGGVLSFTFQSNGDTSLVINGPDGRYYCNDDTNGLDPVLTWRNAPSGQYDVWIGAVGAPAGGTLLFSESPL